MAFADAPPFDIANRPGRVRNGSRLLVIPRPLFLAAPFEAIHRRAAAQGWAFFCADGVRVERA